MKPIAIKNDHCRQTFTGCRVVMTAGVAHSPDRALVIAQVRLFDKFTPDNDPYKEHDMGIFSVNNTSYFFKFDYYDYDYKYFQEDGNRVLTIGRMDEY